MGFGPVGRLCRRRRALLVPTVCHLATGATPRTTVPRRTMAPRTRPGGRRPARAFDGLTYEMVGWRIGFRGATPPSRRSTHEMGRSGQVRAGTQRRPGPEPVGWVRSRWAGTGSGGVGQGIACLSPPRPVSAHHDLSRPTTTCPGSPDVDRSAQPPARRGRTRQLRGQPLNWRIRPDTAAARSTTR